MQRIRILAVGALSESYFKAAVAEYIKRLGRYCTLEIVEVPDERAPAAASCAQQRQILQKEGARLLAKLSPEETVITLDLGGEQMTSEQLALKLKALGDAGRRTTFVIGGSLGLDEQVLARANGSLCLSKMTFTHNMARILLLEQIYRGYKINSNEPYHK